LGVANQGISAVLLSQENTAAIIGVIRFTTMPTKTDWTKNPYYFINLRLLALIKSPRILMAVASTSL
jgi:hypothetical protein